MPQHNHVSITDAVIARLTESKDPRFKQLMSSLVRHLHDLVRDVDLSEQEWITAIQFLTETGQASTENRQEFILLSDTLGISTLVVALGQLRAAGSVKGATEATEATIQGPYYWERASELPLGADLAVGVKGEPTLYYGRVTDVEGNPIAGALMDVWSGDGDGAYDMQAPGGDAMYARGKFRTDHEGRYWFWSIRPCFYPVPDDGPVGKMLGKMGRHPYRPGHIHIIVSEPSHVPVTTHLFVAGSPYLDSDALFGVRDSLIVEFESHGPGAAIDGRVMDKPCYSANYDFRLVPAKA